MFNFFLAQNASFCMHLHHSSTDCWAGNVNIDTKLRRLQEQDDQFSALSSPYSGSALFDSCPVYTEPLGLNGV